MKNNDDSMCAKLGNLTEEASTHGETDNGSDGNAGGVGGVYGENTIIINWSEAVQGYGISWW